MRPPATRPAVDSVLVCDKPAGMTSHDVVAGVRRELPRGVRVGHAGTLDPFATGVLLVLVGRATRAQRWLMGLPKRYEVIARFGWVSSTGDPEGALTETGRVPAGDLVLATGVLSQRPPAYSAVKVGGRRAYALARAGEEVELAPREVTVTRFEETGRWEEGARRAFSIECSSGTYVRALIADLGDAYCEALRRVSIGPFDVADADSERPIALFDALSFLPAVPVSPEQGRRLAFGQRVEVGGLEVAAGTTVRVSDPAGPVAIAEVRRPAGEDAGAAGEDAGAAGEDAGAAGEAGAGVDRGVLAVLVGLRG